MSTISLEFGDFTEEVIEFYFLCKDTAVLLTYNQREEFIVQYRCKIERLEKKCVYSTIRKIPFTGRMSIRVGIGAVTEGYILVVGKTSREMGDVCITALIAADPDNCDSFPEYNLDEKVLFVLK